MVHPTTQLSWKVQICADAATPKLPREVQEGRAHWAAWAWRASDAWALAEDAAHLFRELFPQVRPTGDDWMAQTVHEARLPSRSYLKA